jgi:hypothetical protein
MIVMYATGQNGNGCSEIVGMFEEWNEVRVRTGHFAKDVLLTFIEKSEEQCEKVV